MVAQVETRGATKDSRMGNFLHHTAGWSSRLMRAAHLREPIASTSSLHTTPTRRITQSGHHPPPVRSAAKM
jgi:hypothetical protein